MSFFDVDVDCADFTITKLNPGQQAKAGVSAVSVVIRATVW